MSDSHKPNFIDRDSPEWDIMWNRLFQQFSNYDSPQGESWQYMGTWFNNRIWVHQFRHRDYHGERITANIAPSSDYMNKIPQLETA